jgi:putative endonuclease
MDEARPRTAAQLTGDSAEDVVATRLASSGWTILGRNVRVGRAELDIIAIDPGPPRELVVVEVRYRARRDFGLAEETVTHRKRQLLRGALSTLRERGRLPALSTRIDLVVAEPPLAIGDPLRVRHHRHAL